MATTVGVSVATLKLTTYQCSVSMPIRGSSNLQDVLLPLPPSDLALGPEATELERDLVRWANDITARLQQLIQE